MKHPVGDVIKKKQTLCWAHPSGHCSPERHFHMCVSSHIWMAPEDVSVVQHDAGETLRALLAHCKNQTPFPIWPWIMSRKWQSRKKQIGDKLLQRGPEGDHNTHDCYKKRCLYPRSYVCTNQGMHRKIVEEVRKFAKRNKIKNTNDLIIYMNTYPCLEENKITNLLLSQ